ncbi:helix-turn-helix domain-containing protein [Amycolatopsis sp. CA-230715]|uniref:helix-turn-helix domain-containing protein n=1 Tax=Amycolatopsis sp. CA-230715 TaxID=2745196 RepID=UPI001C037608|nr:helix-turn-helix domain-containing protein [Amycolatopsis sp. CA-230715]QWF84722.1 hypothetical protein HUW46_08174 [Amycolatopsis sp. CA-230715]
MQMEELAKRVRSADPAMGLRAVGALHRLAEQVEALSVARARDQGWTWEQIGDALGMSRQSVHAKYGK